MATGEPSRSRRWLSSLRIRTSVARPTSLHPVMNTKTTRIADTANSNDVIPGMIEGRTTTLTVAHHTENRTALPRGRIITATRLNRVREGMTPTCNGSDGRDQPQPHAGDEHECQRLRPGSSLLSHPDHPDHHHQGGQGQQVDSRNSQGRDAQQHTGDTADPDRGPIQDFGDLAARLSRVHRMCGQDPPRGHPLNIDTSRDALDGRQSRAAVRGRRTGLRGRGGRWAVPPRMLESPTPERGTRGRGGREARVGSGSWCRV